MNHNPSSIILPPSSPAAVPLPLPSCAVNVRPGTNDDIPFIDRLQKLHEHQVGWMPRKQLEGKIALGHVIVADDALKRPVGYCMGNDRYFKRDDVGIIYQLNVEPGRQRSFVGATLLKAMFDRAAYGCRLFCCWCAQDIEANRFWESMGFVPLAFRTGSAKKLRVHIFWQRRIRAGDETTPWWFPSQTSGGAIREDRLVLPIPPDTHWSDAKPIILPGCEKEDAQPRLPMNGARKKSAAGCAIVESAPPGLNGGAITRTTGLHFQVAPDPADSKAPGGSRAPRQKKPRVKSDPKLVAAARELRDRWLEKVNEMPALPSGKYDLTRALEAPRNPQPLLEAA